MKEALTDLINSYRREGPDDRGCIIDGKSITGVGPILFNAYLEYLEPDAAITFGSISVSSILGFRQFVKAGFPEQSATYILTNFDTFLSWVRSRSGTEGFTESVELEFDIAEDGTGFTYTVGKTTGTG